MTDYTDLVKRLRMTTKYVAFHGRISALRDNREGPEAADAIEAQAARIAELEAALKEISRRTGILITQNQGRWTMTLEHDRRTVDVLSVNQEIARAALEGK